MVCQFSLELLKLGALRVDDLVGATCVVVYTICGLLLFKHVTHFQVSLLKTVLQIVHVFLGLLLLDCTSLKVERVLAQLFTDVVKILCVPDITVTFSLMNS